MEPICGVGLGRHQARSPNRGVSASELFGNRANRPVGKPRVGNPPARSGRAVLAQLIEPGRTSSRTNPMGWGASSTPQAIVRWLTIEFRHDLNHRPLCGTAADYVSKARRRRRTSPMAPNMPVIPKTIDSEESSGTAGVSGLSEVRVVPSVLSGPNLEADHYV